MRKSIVGIFGINLAGKIIIDTKVKGFKVWQMFHDLNGEKVKITVEVIKEGKNAKI